MNHLLDFNFFNTVVIEKSLNEASEETDKMYADIADEVYEKVCQLLRDGVYQKQGDYFVMAGRDIDYKYHDLIITFVHESHPLINKEVLPSQKINYAYGSKGAYKLIICSNLINPGDDTYIDTRLNRYSFIHELTHYLDSKRYRGDVNKNTKEISSASDYYNTPHEFNAYYQESANSIRRMMNKQSLRNIFCKDFETFRKYFTRMLNKGFVANLNNKYKHKLDKRIYNLYSEIIKHEPTE